MSSGIFTLTFALLLIGVSGTGAIEIGQFEARRAEIRKIEALGLAAMERAGGTGGLACQFATENLAITCEFGGGELALIGRGLPVIRVGWRPSEP